MLLNKLLLLLPFLCLWRREPMNPYLLVAMGRCRRTVLGPRTLRGSVPWRNSARHNGARPCSHEKRQALPPPPCTPAPPLEANAPKCEYTVSEMCRCVCAAVKPETQLPFWFFISCGKLLSQNLRTFRGHLGIPISRLCTKCRSHLRNPHVRHVTGIHHMK